MTDLELVPGYPDAWGADKLECSGGRLNGEAGKVIGGGLARLDAEVNCWLEPGDGRRRQARGAVEEAAEADPAFAATSWNCQLNSTRPATAARR